MKREVSKIDQWQSTIYRDEFGIDGYVANMATIETITLKLHESSSPESFIAANSKVEAEYLPSQPGFNAGSRRTTVGADGVWTISMRWDSAYDANESMRNFMSAPATQDFLRLVDTDSMSMGQVVEVPPLNPPRLNHATRLYLEGIRDGDARRAVEEFTGDRYTQHSTGVRDGVEGFVEFFEPFIERNPDRQIEILRSFVDGRFVFVHVAQSLNGGESRWVTADLFDTDGNEKIVEHWDVIAELGGTNPAGHTQIDGSTDIVDLHLTEANKDHVWRFLTEAFCEEPTAPFSDFISAETYINHNPEAPDGLAALEEMDRASRAKGEALFYAKVHSIIGQGNFVVAFAHQVCNSIDYAAFDIFRLEDGMIVEHWDNVEVIPPADELANSGKF